MVVCGILLGFACGYAFDLHNNGWVWTFRIAYLLAILMGAMSLYLPNSPSWYGRLLYDYYYFIISIAVLKDDIPRI